MYGAEVWLCLLFFFVCLLSLFHGLCWNQHVTTLLHFPFFFLIIFLTCYHFSFHQHHFSFSATRISMVTTFILINLWSLGSSPPRHYQCFIHVNFIFFPVDPLSLHQFFSSTSHCSDEHVILGIFIHQMSLVICSFHFHHILANSMCRVRGITPV